MAITKPADVDAYIAAVASETRSTLMEIRQAMRSAVAAAEEGISWGVPFYKYHGALGGFAVFSKHAHVGRPTNWTTASVAGSKRGYATDRKAIRSASASRCRQPCSNKSRKRRQP